MSEYKRSNRFIEKEENVIFPELTGKIEQRLQFKLDDMTSSFIDSEIKSDEDADDLSLMMYKFIYTHPKVLAKLRDEMSLRISKYIDTLTYLQLDTLYPRVKILLGVDKHNVEESDLTKLVSFVIEDLFAELTPSRKRKYVDIFSSSRGVCIAMIDAMVDNLMQMEVKLEIKRKEVFNV